MITHMTATKKGKTMKPVEVITSVERRRRWTDEEKRAMVQEAEQPGMFEDYKETAPHKGLKMMSLREYRRLQNKLEGCPV
jgi:transposase-like protein